MFGRDRTMTGLIGSTVLVPVDGDTVRGRLVDVSRRWARLEACEHADGPVDGTLYVRLPVAWVQVAP